MDSRTRSTAAHLVMNVSYATRPGTPSRNSWLHPSHKCGTSSDSCRKLHVCISRYLVSGSCRDAFLRALDLTTPTCLGKSSETQIVLDRRTQTRPNTMSKSSCFLKLRQIQILLNNTLAYFKPLVGILVDMFCSLFRIPVEG